jgi:hypothetical protein
VHTRTRDRATEPDHLTTRGIISNFNFQYSECRRTVLSEKLSALYACLMVEIAELH